MGTVTTLPFGRPLTRADLELMPDDGHRYELLDGVLVVTPAPGLAHQRAVARLHLALAHACTREYEVLFAPFAVVLADDTELQPDLLVARRTDLTARDLPAAPALAVEVLSRSTRRFDLLSKRSRYEAARTAAYWAVDPDEPSIRAWELRNGAYVEVGCAVGDDAVELTTPFPVTLVPAALVADPR